MLKRTYTNCKYKRQLIFISISWFRSEKKQRNNHGSNAKRYAMLFLITRLKYKQKTNELENQKGKWILFLKKTRAYISNTWTEFKSNKNTTHCSNCNDSSDQLEQLFNCLFGYSKKYRVKYLATHKVEKIDFTLENSLNVYRYFKPNELPEYDSKKDKKIGTEVKTKPSK